MKNMKDVVIVSSVRSPIGRGIKGSFRDTRPDTLGSIVVREALDRSKVPYEMVEDVIMGCAMPEAEQGMNVARAISLMAGLPTTCSAATVNRFCSSGLHALADVAKSIWSGQIKVGVGGGVESMSMVPMGGHRPSANPELMSKMPTAYMPMGLTAENVAKRFSITRAMQDEFALESHRRALNAIEKGWFKDEIVSVNTGVFEENGVRHLNLSVDEGPRANTTLDALANLKPAFDNEGTVTAGNASQISDGAAACVLIDADEARKFKLPILGYFRAFVTAGVDPDLMGIGPVPAILKLMQQTGLKTHDIDVFEINEAFAAQAVYCVKELELDTTKVNPCGGAIALGHPLGCTGARQVATILRELKRRNGKYGVVSMCIGGGMGAAGLIEV